jgi:hypothetical protein
VNESHRERRGRQCPKAASPRELRERLTVTQSLRRKNRQQTAGWVFCGEFAEHAASIGSDAGKR